jgi:hypothetical protein
MINNSPEAHPLEDQEGLTEEYGYDIEDYEAFEGEEELTFEGFDDEEEDLWNGTIEEDASFYYDLIPLEDLDLLDLDDLDIDLDIDLDLNLNLDEEPE